MRTKSSPNRLKRHEEIKSAIVVAVELAGLDWADLAEELELARQVLQRKVARGETASNVSAADLLVLLRAVPGLAERLGIHLEATAHERKRGLDVLKGTAGLMQRAGEAAAMVADAAADGVITSSEAKTAGDQLNAIKQAANELEATLAGAVAVPAGLRVAK